jgi:hypothetical protein
MSKPAVLMEVGKAILKEIMKRKQGKKKATPKASDKKTMKPKSSSKTALKKASGLMKHSAKGKMPYVKDDEDDGTY